jgi:hypothetical protein
MTALVFEFIHKCDSLGITPEQTHIESFLSKINKMQYRDNFIRFCHFHWENRHDEYFITNILQDIH